MKRLIILAGLLGVAVGASFRAGKLSAKNRNCTDFSLWQRGQEAQKFTSAALTSPDPTKAIPQAIGLYSAFEAHTVRVRRDAGSDQLAQLRTVVLLI